MKKKLLISCLLLVAVMVLSCVAVLSVGAEETMTMADVAAQAAVPAVGDTVTISDEAELKAFSAYVSAGGVTEGITFRLENDIALEIVNNENTTNFNPIGGVYNTSSAAPVAFLGTFDGNGKTVSGLIFTDMYVQADGTAVSIGANSANLGFFSLLGEGATVENLSLTVKAAKDIGGDYFGVLASKAVGASIISCNVNGEGTNNQLYNFLDGTLGVAGVVGYAEGSVINGCKVNVKANGAGASVAGVVAVAKNTDIRNCVASGTYKHTTQGAVGGVVAKLEGSSVKNCYSSATLTTDLNKSTEYLGGIAGQVDDTSVVENCFSDAILSTTKKNPKLGSLVGLNEGLVKHSFALRDPKLDGTETNHSDIGKNNGTKEDVSPYQPKTENGETVFLLGTIGDSTGSVPCEYCYGDGCDACGWEGFSESTVYSFVPAASGSTSLVDALNAWCDENATTDVNYVKWAVSGSNIINCDHKAPVGYTAYAGKAPTCSATGLGDKYCTACKVVLETNAEIPADSNKHSAGTFACLEYECTYCHEMVAARTNHTIGDKHCVDQACSTCGTVVPASASHTHPEGFDNTDKPCLEYTCAKCGKERVKDAEHDMPTDFYPCQTVECGVCQMTVKPTEYHSPGRAATCTRNQICLECGDIVRAATGHNWGEAASCGKAQLCLNCDIPNPDAPATGDHIYDRHAEAIIDPSATPEEQEAALQAAMRIPTADCLNKSVCVYCGHVGQAALGHSTSHSSTTCGLGNACNRCNAVVATASGDHIVDLSRATVIRAPEDGRSGIAEGICLVCGRKVEIYTTDSLVEKNGNVQIDGGDVSFYADSYVNATFGKVADYQFIRFPKGYVPVQAVTITIAGMDGVSAALPGNVTIKFALNKSASLLEKDAFKLYRLNAKNNLVEVASIDVKDGFLSFSSSMLGTFILVAEEKVAFEEIGTVLSVQPNQTVALVGTVAYERRDFEI